MYTMFIMQAYQSTRYVVLHDGIVIGKWRSSLKEVPMVKSMTNQPAL
jgi:hypothetical protein